MLRVARTIVLFATAASLPLAAASAEEGMWTFDAFPAAKMRAEYGWAPDQAWLDRVQAAAVRLTGGCSASFVSDTGLILTNHHCVASCLQDLSTAKNDRQARAIADAIAEKLGPAYSVEGMTSAHWILLDYGDVVFHVFQEEARRFYALERLWGDAANETGVFAERPSAALRE